MGEHTDYNGGACLPITLPERTYVAISPHPGDAVTLVSD
jgi:galactokinase